MDPSQAVLTPISEINNATGCPSPQPFTLNINSSEAFLRGNSFDGVQPDDAGSYTCYSSGVPRATVNIIVLCKIPHAFLRTTTDFVLVLQLPRLQTNHKLSFGYQLCH